MTTNKYELDTGPCCSPQWVNDKDYESEGGPCSDKRKMLINPPPKDGKCTICGRHVRELEAFGGPGDPLVGDFSGAKLVKNFRWDYPYHVGSTWECRDCFVRPEPIWWIISEEERLGRRLTDIEVVEIQREFELEAERFDAGIE